MVGAINLNDLSAPIRLVATIRANGPLIQGHMLRPFPIADQVFYQIVANKLPAFNAMERAAIASEAFRVLQPLGSVRIMNSVPKWVKSLQGVGLQNFTVSRRFVVASKP